ncbi:MAG: urate hydroxylase PuuD, partial [Steroidobacteraceae bacterium]|nr:urate hydroxylase PuuD [Steroidobacteraceae bacterium]
LSGAWLLDVRFLEAFSFGATVGGSYYGLVMGIGVWLGTIMLFNVWVFIWPNQKKVIGVTPATDEEKAKARRVATLVSRTNFVLSIPMLLCMGAASHGMPL